MIFKIIGAGDTFFVSLFFIMTAISGIISKCFYTPPLSSYSLMPVIIVNETFF